MASTSSTEALVQALAEAARLLREVGETRWATSLDRAKSRLADGDSNALAIIAGMYGGMGSFNDLMIHSANGHSVDDDRGAHVNDRLDVLRQKIHRLTIDLRAESDHA